MRGWISTLISSSVATSWFYKINLLSIILVDTIFLHNDDDNILRNLSYWFLTGTWSMREDNSRCSGRKYFTLTNHQRDRYDRVQRRSKASRILHLVHQSLKRLSLMADLSIYLHKSVRIWRKWILLFCLVAEICCVELS